MKDIQKLLDEVITKLEKVSEEHPYIVIILMHEITRLLWPSDPYIPKQNNGDKHHIEYFKDALENSIGIIDLIKNNGSYKMKFNNNAPNDDIKDKVADVYGKVWGKNDEIMVQEAKDIIEERFSKNSIDLSYIKGKRVLDMGCGSGRYTCALAMLGAETVVGVDFGDDGLQKGKALAKHYGLSVDFKKMDILNLEFEDNSFDFIFCNGVTHHSEDMQVATNGLYRILKDGGYAWYFVYGAHGWYYKTHKAFNDLMKRIKIPQDYAQKILNIIGMPENRHIFADFWYVPILKTTTKDEFKKMLRLAGFTDFRRCVNG